MTTCSKPTFTTTHYIQCKWLLLGLCMPMQAGAWGFFAHKEINEKAVYLLPEAMLIFYKPHIYYIREHAVDPDKRRYLVDGEAPYHYIDMEHYEQLTSLDRLPSWQDVIVTYPKTTIDEHGILPWHILKVKEQLTQAFRARDAKRILRLSADLGHYVGDAHVPLHTTDNYDGQLSGQEGIHALWESRIPELFAEDYNFFFEQKAVYIPDLTTAVWGVINNAHEQLATTLAQEHATAQALPCFKHYCFEQRGTTLKRTHTYTYADHYHHALQGMVERQMRASIQMVANIWYTAWIDAGSPDLSGLSSVAVNQVTEDIDDEPSDNDEDPFDVLNVRPHE